MKTRTWLVRLYPPSWRARYGDEFEALLEECLHSPLDILDVALGALDAHLGITRENNWRLMNMVNKLRTTILLVFAAYIAFVIGGLGLFGLVDDSPAAALMKTDSAISAAWRTIEAASVITLLAVVVGGLPLAFTVIRRALTSSRRDLRLLLVPVLAFLAIVLYVVFMSSIASGWLQVPGIVRAVSPGNFPIGNRIALGGLILVFVLGAIASVVAVWKVMAGTDVEETTFQILGRTSAVKLYQFAFAPAVIASLGMLVMLGGTLVFGWQAHSSLPNWFMANQGLLLTNTGLSYGTTVAIMILSTAAAFFALIRSRSGRKTV
jgi:hypothetical protein